MNLLAELNKRLPIKALSLTSNVVRWLGHSRRPGILHVFENACNLVNESREILSIVTPQIGNGPFNLVVEADVSFDQHITAESSIALHKNEIVIGNLQIDAQKVQVWDPSPNWELLYSKRGEVLSRLAQTGIPDYEPSIPASLLSPFVAAVLRVDISAIMEIVPNLAGLGNGLTPAGDDFIMGAMHAAWIIHPPSIASHLTRQIADAAAPLTTSLSAAWLRSAGRGEAGILWHELFDALISVRRTTSPTYATNKILSVGETSGADALAGFIQVLFDSQQSSTA